jgi:hypothetical protein
MNRHHRRRQARLDRSASSRPTQRKLYRDAIRLGAAVRGCTCFPDIRHRKTGGLVFDVALYHDEACPAYDTGTQLILLPGGHR